LVRHIRTWNSYSPSTGNVWTARQAADGAERQAVEMMALRQVLTRAVGLAAGAGARSPTATRADPRAAER
jgi:hypothetical protein